jgi:hypothetical protein
VVTYSGDFKFAKSISSTTSEMVNQAASATTVSSSVNPSVACQSVTLTATVAAVAPGTGVATGTVTFDDGVTSIGTATLGLSGQASLAVTNFIPGTHSIMAHYSGDSNFTNSNSTAMSHVVNQAASATTVSSSANPSLAGQSLTLTATAVAVAPGAGVPTGTITFNDAGTSIGTAPLSLSGQANLTVSNFVSATHTITATYTGDANFSASSSISPLLQVVNATDFSLTASSAPPVNAGASATFIVTIAANPAPFNSAVGSFSCAGLPQGAACQFSPNSVTPGNGSAPVMLTIGTTSRTQSVTALFRGSDGSEHRQRPLPILLAFSVIGVAALTGKRAWRTRSLLACLFLGCLVWFGCASGSGTSGPTPNPTGTPAGTYQITVTAVASGGATHTVVATLKVN